VRFAIETPNHVGRGKYPRDQQRQRWARRESNPHALASNGS
jgi:hypothetical protein